MLNGSIEGSKSYFLGFFMNMKKRFGEAAIGLAALAMVGEGVREEVDRSNHHDTIESSSKRADQKNEVKVKGEAKEMADIKFQNDVFENLNIAEEEMHANFPNAPKMSKEVLATKKRSLELQVREAMANYQRLDLKNNVESAGYYLMEIFDHLPVSEIKQFAKANPEFKSLCVNFRHRVAAEKKKVDVEIKALVGGKDASSAARVADLKKKSSGLMVLADLFDGAQFTSHDSLPAKLDTLIAVK